MNAQHFLAACLFSGRGCDEDKEEAIEWLRKAAEQGDGSAQKHLANCLYGGSGCEINRKEAVEWYKKSAEQGDVDAQYDLARCLENGEGCAKNLDEAIKWYEKAAEQGNDIAVKAVARLTTNKELFSEQEDSGDIYLKYCNSGCFDSILTQKDTEEMNRATNQHDIITLREFAGRGSKMAQKKLAAILENYYPSENNMKEVIFWRRKLAKYGDSEEQYNLARCLYSGRSCENQICEQNTEEAIFWLEKSSEQGNEDAKDALVRIKNNSSTSSHVAAQSSGCLLPILVTFAVILMLVNF